MLSLLSEYRIYCLFWYDIRFDSVSSSGRPCAEWAPAPTIASDIPRPWARGASLWPKIPDMYIDDNDDDGDDVERHPKRRWLVNSCNHNTNIAVKFHLTFYHFVCPPFASTTAWQRSFIFLIHLAKSEGCNALHSSSTHCLNSPRVRGDLLATLCFNRRQTFSIGFRSGELAGQHILSIPFRSWSCFVSLAVCGEAPSSMRIACLKRFPGCCAT